MYKGLPWFGVSFMRVESKGGYWEARFNKNSSEMDFLCKNLKDFLNLDYYVMIWTIKSRRI